MATTPAKPGTVESWVKKSTINAFLPTGMNVDLRTLTLDELASLDGLPDDLARVALLEMQPGGIVGAIGEELDKADKAALARARKLSADNLKLRDRLVLAAVIKPALTAEKVAKLDGYDKEMIADIASRRRQFDAADRRVSGVTPVSMFQAVADECGCGPDCPARAKAREISAVLR